MGNPWTPDFASSSTSPSSTRPSSPEIAQNTSNEGTHLGTGSALSTRLDEDFPNRQILTTPGRFYKQKLVVQVDMHDAKSRSKTLKIVVGIPGLTSAAILGADKDQLALVGEGIDPINVIRLLRKHEGSKRERLLSMSMVSKIERLLGMSMGCIKLVSIGPVDEVL